MDSFSIESNKSKMGRHKKGKSIVNEE